MTDQQEKFSQVLAEDIFDEIKKAFPSYRGTPYRLETEDIKEIFDMEYPDYNSLENDFEVWRELEAVPKRSDVLDIVKDCLRKFNIECNDAQFNSFKKESLIIMFFTVFDVFPKLNPEIQSEATSASEEKPQDDEKIFEQYKDKIFLDEIHGKIKIEYAEIENIMPEKISISDSSTLRQFMTDFKNGKKIKTFFKQCCEKFGVELNEKKFDLLTKEIYIPLFFSVFDVNFPESDKKIDTQKKSHSSESEKISEHKQIEKIEPLSFEQIKKIYDSAEKFSPDSSSGFDVCNTVKVFENMPITLFDRFWVRVPENYPIFYGCAALINAVTNEVTASGRIENNLRNENEILPHLIFDSKKIDHEQFKYGREYKVMLIPADKENFFTDGKSDAEYSGKIYLLECDIDYGELTTTSQPLCIDFGTSNTTAGTYGLNSDSDEIQLVKFRDVTAKKIVETEMLPTIVLVDSFENDNPVYKFGYEAKKEIIDSDYNIKASVFYEIKRWINSADRSEEKLFDKNGNTVPKKFKHTDILKSYLEYVIAMAEQQFKVKFKRLHFTAPVKLKSRFLNIVNRLFPSPEFSIEKEETSLDEGVAVVYHHISKFLSDSNASFEKKSGDILILDCGGGTTDLASCHFEIKESNLMSRVLNIQTGFENGESNFGGNNVTFRILQMLKIKIAAHLQHQGNLTMDKLITEDENEILTRIDKSYEEKNEIYKKFVAKYDEAEKLIPTKFAEYDGRTEKYKVKRNYYYLWQMAEMIKIEFYRSNLVVNLDFEKEKDRKIYVDDMSKYYLYVRDPENNSLKNQENPMDKVEVTIKEINRIICPDIYALLNTLLRQYSGNRMETLNELNKYSYRLSGQSCKIALFHDLLKEFIPGVLIRLHNSKSASQSDGESSRLKKACIEGSIKYMRDKAKGKIKPIQNTATPKNIYDVFMDDKCIFSRDGNIEVIKGSNYMRELTLTVKDSNHQKKRPQINYKFHFEKKEDYSPYNIEKLAKEIGDFTPLSSEEINLKILNSLRSVNLDKDNGGAPVSCVFTVPARDGYGFYIWEVIIAKDKKGDKSYFAPKPQFETFEEESFHTFFNGDK